MKIATAMFVVLAGMTVYGCGFGTQDSPQGGIVPKDEEFSVTVPTSNTVKQGANKTVTVSLNRGAYFKRDVRLEIQTEGISVTPTNVLIKASESPDVRLQIAVAKDAALGEYRVTVRATPEAGDPTATAFTVKVVAP
jgi:uncharacterized membrane protein